MSNENETQNTGSEGESKTEGSNSELAKLRQEMEYWKAETKKVVHERQTEKLKAEEARAEAARIAEEEARTKARSKQDVEALEKSYKTEIEKERSQSSTWREKYFSTAVKSAVDELSGRVLDKKGSEVFYKLNKDKIEYFETESGEIVPKIKNDVRSFNEVVLAFAEEYPAFKANKTKAGSGSQGGKVSSETSWSEDRLRSEDLSKLDEKQRRELFNKYLKGELQK